MSNNTELTTTDIASMSEVVAEYMEWVKKERDGDYYYLMTNGELFWYNTNDAIDWNIIHEVWDNIRDEERVNTTPKYCNALNNISYGTPLEAFTALFNAIQFINKLKQEK